MSQFISPSKRLDLYRQAGFRCAVCRWRSPVRGLLERPPARGERHLTLDHVVPRSLGGPDSMWNLVVMCNVCNHAKSSQLWPALIVTRKARRHLTRWMTAHPDVAACAAPVPAEVALAA